MADVHEIRFPGLRTGTTSDESTLTFGSKNIWDVTDPGVAGEDCAFCDEPEHGDFVNAFDLAVPIVEGEIALKGSLGMLRPGYLLGVTRQHLTSFAQLSPEILEKTDQAFQTYEERICRELSLLGCGAYTGYVRIEHGSDNVSTCGLGAGACIVHAHQHLILTLATTVERLITALPTWEVLGSYAELAGLRGEPYLYVGHEGEHRVVVNPGVPSQWARRIIAEEDGHSEWDWALKNGALNLFQTFIAAGLLSDGQMIISGKHDTVEYRRRKRSRHPV